MLHTCSTFILCKKKLCQSALAIILSISIVGCSSIDSSNNSQLGQQITQDWLANKALLQRIQEFETKGKVIFKSNKQNISANFHWQQKKNSLSLRLTNFLGATLLKLDSSPTGTTLIDHRGKHYHGSNMSALITSLTGVNLPVAEFGNWLKALPNENNAYQLNSHNNLARLTQNSPPNQQLGWDITYPSYRVFQEVVLPERISMRFKDQLVDLSISHWVLL